MKTAFEVLLDIVVAVLWYVAVTRGMDRLGQGFQDGVKIAI